MRVLSSSIICTVCPLRQSQENLRRLTGSAEISCFQTCTEVCLKCSGGTECLIHTYRRKAGPVAGRRSTGPRWDQGEVTQGSIPAASPPHSWPIRTGEPKCATDRRFCSLHDSQYEGWRSGGPPGSRVSSGGAVSCCWGEQRLDDLALPPPPDGRKGNAAKGPTRSDESQKVTLRIIHRRDRDIFWNFGSNF